MTETAEISPATATTSPRRSAALLTSVTLLWLVGHTVMRAVLVTLGSSEPLSAVGSDLIIITGWWSVALPVLALVAVAAQAMLIGRSPAPVLRGSVVAVGALTAAALMISGALILLDLVGGILPGLGVVFYPLGALHRAVCVAAAVLVGAHTWRFWTATRPQTRRRPRNEQTPGWVVVIGYLTVAACLARLGAQLIVGLDATPFPVGAASILFEIGFLLAGILLPLALVHRWGRIWPGWVPWLRGRRVPRMLLIVCGAGLSIPMIAYFGMMTAQMIVERMQGRNPFPPSDGIALPEAFFWVSVPAYLIWGIGLAIGTISYARVTATRGADAHPA